MENNVIDFDDDLSLEALLNSANMDFPDVNQLFSEVSFQSSDNIEPLSACEKSAFPVIVTEEHQPQSINGSQFIEGLEEFPSHNLNKKPKQHEENVTMTTTANDAKNFNKYISNPTFYHFELPTAPALHQQQNLMESIYNINNQILPPMSSTTSTGYLNIDALNMDGLCQGEMSLPNISRSGGGQHFFSNRIMPMLMSTPMPMATPKMGYHNMPMSFYNAQDSVQQHDFGSHNMQLPGFKHLQQQQLHNNSLNIGCSSATPPASNICTVNKSAFTIGRISAEERKEKIARYKFKKSKRNFSKKTKYECRKALADSRPRVRGRFAKVDKPEEMATTTANNYDYNENEVAAEEGDLYGLDIHADTIDDNSFDFNSPIELGFDPLDLLIFD